MLPEQRSLIRQDGNSPVRSSCDCQHQGGREPGWCGKVNSGEALLNVVIKDKPKMLRPEERPWSCPPRGGFGVGLDQKVRGQVRRLRTPPAQLWHHRRRGAT